MRLEDRDQPPCSALTKNRDRRGNFGRMMREIVENSQGLLGRYPLQTPRDPSESGERSGCGFKAHTERERHPKRPHCIEQIVAAGDGEGQRPQLRPAQSECDPLRSHLGRPEKVSFTETIGQGGISRSSQQVRDARIVATGDNRPPTGTLERKDPKAAVNPSVPP
ncbi:hypothetical protein QWZ10_02920 [Paracoccus cavernae]|uniref:Uncharacterized protein n=1 Tax=Paracoccus cavernae TaxID=1571207 RepID=A0ABT8D3G6_9RHOB|nr:hypothetical protein [Paracoccus cavernae]